ncbi:Gfo/Idh/MocA family protein [Lignipirellula cremea]|uniref:Oxidoreductase family, NAD-binding Rossmann fold n=1 Tax=Lignipirellula cremea TaxID=2528010 RepID=A0A518DP60_9BACT|nr:Gfo/Idh/MocA family oxidoreductase [Lignipirellula cremea]QDU93620.1 Oxidoreductase family, NAD-binding Rossmann fold [Lignipirellula cremea]
MSKPSMTPPGAEAAPAAAMNFSRRDLLRWTGSAAAVAAAAQPLYAASTDKVFRIGVVSAAIEGKPQTRNGHTWHFAQYLHPECDFDALKKHYPQVVDTWKNYYRNPDFAFDLLPFPDTRITHYYDADPTVGQAFADVFPGVKVATSLEEMCDEVDAVWMGDASGKGDDHYDLVAPGLARGLPTFCDKPIGGTVEGTRKILDLAKKHQAPLMSGSIFNHEWGMEAALRMRDAGEFGPIEHVSARLMSRYSLDRWMIYGQHPLWTVMTLMGPGIEGISLYEYNDTCHALVTFPDRYPCHVWYGQPYERFEYNRTDVYFKKKLFTFTPSIEGDFAFGHKYEIVRMADAFRKMLHTGKEPKPHQEILEVTAAVHAGALSLQEKNRQVRLEEVMG